MYILNIEEFYTVMKMVAQFVFSNPLNNMFSISSKPDVVNTGIT